MNKSILMGRLVKEPELRTTASGVSVTSFCLAVPRRFKDANGEYPTDWIDCVAWKNTAEFVCKYFQKGQMITVYGSTQTRMYEKDGDKRKITEVNVDEVYFCGESKKSEEKAPAPSLPSQGFVPMPAPDDDLPF